MGARGLLDYRVDHGILLYLEVDQVIGASEIFDSDSSFPPDRHLPYTFPHTGRCRERSAVLLSSALATAGRRQGTARQSIFLVSIRRFDFNAAIAQLKIFTSRLVRNFNSDEMSIISVAITGSNQSLACAVSSY